MSKRFHNVILNFIEMLFKNQDVKSSLLYSGQGPRGTYNQLQWTIDPGEDTTSLLAKIVSIHEFMHNELNNVSGYGFLLQAYAYLSKEITPERDRYAQVLDILIEECRIAHEVYATWLSITVFENDSLHDLASDVLDGNPEYADYYEIGQSFLNGLQSKFLRQQVFTAAIRFCFQSREISDGALRNPALFAPDKVDVREFPNSRLEYIKQNLPVDYFAESVKRFIGNMPSGIEKEMLSQAYGSYKDNVLLIAKGNEHIAENLMKYIYEGLNEHFEKQKSFSLEYDEHLFFFKHLLPKLDHISPFENSQNPLMLNNDPYDYERSMLLNFENETILFCPDQLTAKILLPQEVDLETKQMLGKGVGVPGHIFLMGRSGITLKGQYAFKDERDKFWLDNQISPFTAIRFAGAVKGERTVFYIPFDTLGAFNEFWSDVDNNVPLIGYATVSAISNDEWWGKWSSFFEERMALGVILLDVSPMFYLKRFDVEGLDVFYEKLVIDSDNKKNSAMLFHIKEHGETRAMIPAPCSDMFAHVINAYIPKKYPVFKHALALSDKERLYLPNILNHIFREETSFYYMSEKTNLLDL